MGDMLRSSVDSDGFDQIGQKPHGTKQATASTVQALAEESRSHVDTATAACLLSVNEKTLRRWARQGNGPLTPAREKRRLRWPVRDIRLLVSRD